MSGKQGLNTAYAKNAKKLIFGHSMNFEQYLQDQGKENFIKKKKLFSFFRSILAIPSRSEAAWREKYDNGEKILSSLK